VYGQGTTDTWEVSHAGREGSWKTQGCVIGQAADGAQVLGSLTAFAIPGGLGLVPSGRFAG
jgi:hypothetical protein